MKFSIVIPVYNTEEYIIKCLKSIDIQSYKNYEVIVVNDGSTDKSEKKIKEFIKDKENFKYYKKANGGMSDARNFGLKYVTGDYIIFIDSDDYVDKDLLLEINKGLETKKCDILRYGLKLVDKKGKILMNGSKISLSSDSLSDKIKGIVNHEYVDPAWLYAYKKDFWFNNNFSYSFGRIHEDFGLTLKILSKAQSIEIINYNGYYYVQRKNSVVHTVDYETLKKRTTDFFDLHLENIKEIPKDSLKNKLLLNYSTSALIYKLRELNASDRNIYVKKIKEMKLLKYYSIVSFKTFLLKIYFKLFLSSHIKRLNKKFLNNNS